MIFIVDSYLALPSPIDSFSSDSATVALFTSHREKRQNRVIRKHVRGVI